MKLNLWPLCLIFYRPDLGKRNGLQILGTTKPPFVWIREDCRADESTLRHELWHVGQAWRMLLIFHYLLLWVPRYRAWCEKKAEEACNVR